MTQSLPLDPHGRYLFDAYQDQRPFASFLPGIAGPYGIPLWVFYVNRGQAIAGFGIESKDSPIMEFLPANKAYQAAPYSGFRTFLKLKRGGKSQVYEPFAIANKANVAEQRMAIGANDLELSETSAQAGLKTTVSYFSLPGENFAGLARVVRIQNAGAEPVEMEMLDGLPALIPFGVNNWLLKEMGRTLEAWMEVFNLEARVPFYRLRASVVDKVEVETYQAGHFALAFAEEDSGPQLLPALVDPVGVFGADTSFTCPEEFYRQPLKTLLARRQVTCGRTPCGMFAHQASLEPGQSLAVYSLYGHISGLEILSRCASQITRADYFEKKHAEGNALIGELTGMAETHTSAPIFDAYCRQNFLDNVLRGGWPVLFGQGEKPQVYPIYSRKHGDLERDYNTFFLAPEPFSQGEGSYRDVNQNRRDNVQVNPRIGDYDIRTFMSLIQTDGYNPRTVKGSSFTLTAAQQAALLAKVQQPEKLSGVLAKAFTPGKLLKHILDHEIELTVSPAEFVTLAMQAAEQHIEADFFEGYWIDHWEYNLDLIESYLAVYPDRQEALFFGQADIPFYDSAAMVQPRAKKYVLANGVPRQIGSLVEDKEKEALIASRSHLPRWSRAGHGQGEIYTTGLFAKLFLTTLLKFASLDPWGMGIEMEASRPGWYDALNGLPALFGSGMSETYELQRWIRFLRQVIHASQEDAGTAAGAGADADAGAAKGAGTTAQEVRLPVEAVELLRKVVFQAVHAARGSGAESDFEYWDAVSGAREIYRERTRLGFDGAEDSLNLSDLDQDLALFEQKVAAGIARALELNHGLPPTYFTFSVDEYETLPGRDPAGRLYIQPIRFTATPLPLFLEGPVRAYKVLEPEAARKLYRQVKASPLFDAKLKMYKVNASLDGEPHDIGRARAFPSGWLENGSIWLHMEYKYLLELIRAGLYHEFYEDFRNCLVPFLDPRQYGRSPLENSSFLASSAHPDEALHGAGFVARLSGSTAEFISIWLNMMAGKQPFYMEEGQLRLALKPALPGWLFDENGQVAFRFLGSCLVTYHNPRRLDTFAEGAEQQRIELHCEGGQAVQVAGSSLPAPYAGWVRDGKVTRMDIFYH